MERRNEKYEMAAGGDEITFSIDYPFGIWMRSC